MKDCLFCKIINKEIQTNIVYEDDRLLAFNDINPQAPIHLLIIPKLHISTLNHIGLEHKSLIGEMVLLASKLAKDFDISDNGYRTNFNCNSHGGQTVFHIHLHLLGGRKFHWPPG
ncbi:MAG: histidine triad nucleotide-binding protein [Candidatus Marinimicrobia bacterium]|nr:histidine triad nucleotide-binding protein [Candidatus Neomarinimicrobiota bacterium]